MADTDTDKKPRVLVGSVKSSGPILKWLFIAVIAAVIIGGVYIGVKHWRNRLPYQTGHCANSSNTACALLKEAVPLLDPAKVIQLTKTVDKIKNLKNYDKDPNLMFVIVQYYINLSDAPNSSKNLATLKRVYLPKIGYDSVLNDHTLPMEQLDNVVKFLEDQQKSAKYNFWSVTPNGQQVRMSDSP